MLCYTYNNICIDDTFALALLEHHFPALEWAPADSLAAAEQAYYERFGVWPDYAALATNPCRSASREVSA